MLALLSSVAVFVRANGSALADPPGNPYGVVLATDVNPDPAVVETTLVASEALVDIGNGVMANMWTFNGVVPGPEIRANVGDTVIVHFENQLPEPMGIHWHGIELNNISDGTAITQNGVATGDSYMYRFIVPRAGVFWYHPHHHPTNPTFRGMYGSFIVSD
ncbi:MAG: multicopper oxidase domain-containing protein, partial [Mycobacteriales bacterium]